MVDTKAINGTVINIDDTGNYKGNKKWRVHLQPEGSSGTFLLDIMDNRANNSPGICPAKVGEPFYAEYVDKGWDNARGEHITFHNYRWPIGGGGDSFSGSSPSKSASPSVVMTLSKDVEGTVFTVTASVPSDKTQAGASTVNKAFNELFIARKRISDKPQEEQAKPLEETKPVDKGITDEFPPF